VRPVQLVRPVLVRQAKQARLARLARVRLEKQVTPALLALQARLELLVLA